MTSKEALKKSKYVYLTMWSEHIDKLVLGKKQDILEVDVKDRIYFTENYFIYKAGTFADTWLTYNYEDYGKTWALTRKELENE